MNPDDIRGRAIAQAMWTELEKISGEMTDRALHAAPGVGAVVGGVAGAARPNLFNPESLFPKLRGKGTSAKSRVVSGVLGAGLGATTGWLPTALRDAKRAVLNQKSKTAEVIEGEDGNPVVKVLGASIDKLDEMKAHGVPIVEPPPGFTYNPELRAFAPDESDPGWMTEPETAAAQQSAQSFEAGKEEATTEGAQVEADNQATEALTQQQAEAEKDTKGSKKSPGKKPVAKPAAAAGTPAPPVAPPSPGEITGLHPMAQPDGSKSPVPQVQKPAPRSTNSVAR